MRERRDGGHLCGSVNDYVIRQKGREWKQLSKEGCSLAFITCVPAFVHLSVSIFFFLGKVSISLN